MKFSVMKNFKIWIIVTLALIVGGMFILGFVGFNNPVDFKVSYQLKVDVEEDFADSISIAKSVTDKFFKDNGISDLDYAFYTGDDGSVVYSFHEDVADKIDGLEEKLQIALNDAGVNLEAKVSTTESTPYFSKNVLNIALAVGVSAIAIMIYLIIMEKPASALAVLGSTLLSALIFASLLAITRVPALPFALATIVFSALLSALLATLFVSKAKAIVKNVANDKLTKREIADKAFGKNVLPLIGVLAVSIVSAILFIAIGTGYLKFLGIQIALGGISAVFSAGAWTPVIWSALRKGKTKKITADEE